MRRLLALLALSSTALAHTAVTGLQPAAHATVSQPKVVTMKLSEPIPLHFATFKVYPLGVKGDKLTLNRAAASLSPKALADRNDADKRADLWKTHNSQASTVTIPLKPDLTPGAYAVLWRFLSEDGHVVSGQSVFNVK